MATVPNRSDRIKVQIEEKRDQVEEMVSKYAADPDAMPNDEIKQVRDLDAEISSLLADFSEARQDEDRAKSNREAMAQIFGSESKSDDKGVSDGDREPERKTRAASLSEMVMADKQFKAWHDEMTAGGTKPISERVSVKSPPVEIDFEVKTLVTGLSATSGGAFVVNDRTDIVVPLLRNDLNILDLVTVMPTSSDNVEFVRATTETNAAAGVAEATSGSDGAKPESALAWAVVTSPIETIAHWIPVTRRAVADAPQLSGFIDNFLFYGLRTELATQVLTGASTPDLVGIANTANVQAQAFDTDILTTTRKARTLVKTVGGGMPSAYVIPPESWETIDLLQDNEARYLFGGPQRMGSPVLWGLPVVESEHAAADTGYVGDWRQAVLWDRMQATIYMTDSHSDFFIRNILVLLAEMRAGFSLLRPQNFVEITLA